MKNLLANIILNSGEDLLKKPGDKFTAEITKSGRGVAKLKTSEKKMSMTYYPSTRTRVTTITERGSDK